MRKTRPYWRRLSARGSSVSQTRLMMARLGMVQVALLVFSTHAANYHEVTLVQLSFDFYMLEAKPEHLIGDRAYDSDGLDDDPKQDGVDMIAPHRSTRKLKTQGGRRLRRYQRRWLVERFFAWLQWKHRLLIRWEYYAANFLGFVQLASITILLKRF